MIKAQMSSRKKTWEYVIWKWSKKKWQYLAYCHLVFSHFFLCGLSFFFPWKFSYLRAAIFILSFFFPQFFCHIVIFVFSHFSFCTSNYKGLEKSYCCFFLPRHLVSRGLTFRRIFWSKGKILKLFPILSFFFFPRPPNYILSFFFLLLEKWQENVVYVNFCNGSLWIQIFRGNSTWGLHGTTK